MDELRMSTVELMAQDDTNPVVQQLARRLVEAIRALASPVRERVLIPQETWDWLMGETRGFEPTDEQKASPFGPGRYWWRSQLREALLKAAPEEK